VVVGGVGDPFLSLGLVYWGKRDLFFLFLNILFGHSLRAVSGPDVDTSVGDVTHVTEIFTPCEALVPYLV